MDEPNIYQVLIFMIIALLLGYKISESNLSRGAKVIIWIIFFLIVVLLS